MSLINRIRWWRALRAFHRRHPDLTINIITVAPGDYITETACREQH